VSPILCKRYPFGQFCQLLLTINSFGILIMAVASGRVPHAPRTGTSQGMQSLVIRRLRPVLTGHGYPAAGHKPLLTRARNAAGTAWPARGIVPAITRDRRSPWCSYPTPIGCLASPGPRPSPRRLLPWHTVRGINSPLLASSPPRGLPLPRGPRINGSGRRHTVMPSG
jgi:hypothetical protein